MMTLLRTIQLSSWGKYLIMRPYSIKFEALGQTFNFLNHHSKNENITNENLVYFNSLDSKNDYNIKFNFIPSFLSILLFVIL